MRKLLFLGITAFFISTAAKADILIEPFVGYMMGKTDETAVVSSPPVGTIATKYDSKGALFGGRLGYEIMGFAFGGDYTAGTLKLKPDDGSESSDLKTTNIGAFLAYEFPILLRVYGAYMVSAKAKDDSDTEIEGSGYKVGVGYTGLPFISINVEMVNIKYDKVTSSPFTVDSYDNKTSGWMLGISLPLTF